MKQAERMYLISDAAKQVQVESHVLRYWEEELGLPIKRNELGHRYYTEEDIERFKEVRDLKEQGLQLKAIRSLLNRAEMQPGANYGIGGMQQAESRKRHVLMVNKGEFMPVHEESREAKSLRLQQLLQTMITEAVKSNNQEVCEEIKDTLLKELDYQFRLQEEREEERELIRIDRQEEHYRRVDELIRSRNQKKSASEKKAERKEERALQAKHLEEIMQQRKEEKKQTVSEYDEQMVKSEGENENEQTKGKEKREKNKFGFLRKKRSIV